MPNNQSDNHVFDGCVSSDVVAEHSQSSSPLYQHMVTRSQLGISKPNPKHAMTAIMDVQYTEPSYFSQAVKQEE